MLAFLDPASFQLDLWKSETRSTAALRPPACSPRPRENRSKKTSARFEIFSFIGTSHPAPLPARTAQVFDPNRMNQNNASPAMARLTHRNLAGVGS